MARSNAIFRDLVEDFPGRQYDVLTHRTGILGFLHKVASACAQ